MKTNCCAVIGFTRLASYALGHLYSMIAIQHPPTKLGFANYRKFFPPALRTKNIHAAMTSCLSRLTLGALLIGAIAQHGLLGAESSNGVAPAGYKLVWSDEFDYSGLPDPSKWAYEEGFIRNKESQYYTKARLENARVEHGHLIIEARKEDYPYVDKNGQSKIASYTSASVITLGKASWKYGRIEIRAKMPHGQGVWPALWTMGENRAQVKWPFCGEIDLLETKGDCTNIEGNFHYAIKGKHKASGRGSIIVPTAASEYHVYTLDWDSEKIVLSADGEAYAGCPVTLATAGSLDPFRLPNYLIMNLALGGPMGGRIDDAIFPQQMVIDYVRVYQRK